MSEDPRAALEALIGPADPHPLGFLVNLFDVALVLALAFLLQAQAAPLPRFEPAPPDAQATEAPLAAGGERLGVAWRLPDGAIVYVPERPSDDSPGPRPASR